MIINEFLPENFYFVKILYIIGPLVIISSTNSSTKSKCQHSSLSSRKGFYLLPKDGHIISTSEIKSILLSLPSYKSSSCEVSKGRIHYNLIKSPEFMQIIKSVLGKISHIVKSEMNHIDDERSVILTEVQIVESFPGSVPQIWHADNSRYGLTFVIPLCELTELNSIELLVGSHEIVDFLWLTLKNKISGNNQISVEKPLLEMGECVVFDARLLHRGGSNETIHSRPILVIRYDYEDSKPPGMNWIGTTLRNLFGMVIMKIK
jgi:hypothetical protein